jgi:hypothetical protein
LLPKEKLMQVKTHSPKQTVVGFLREEAPQEYERLESIGQLVRTSLGIDRDPSQLWVLDSFGHFAN